MRRPYGVITLAAYRWLIATSRSFEGDGRTMAIVVTASQQRRGRSQQNGDGGKADLVALSEFILTQVNMSPQAPTGGTLYLAVTWSSHVGWVRGYIPLSLSQRRAETTTCEITSFSAPSSSSETVRKLTLTLWPRVWFA